MKNLKKWRLVIDESSADEERRTFRLRVAGGHLYRYELNTPSSSESRQIVVSIVFVPDCQSVK